MKLAKFVLSFTLTCLVGGVVYFAWRNNFWNVFERIKQESPEAILAQAFEQGTENGLQLQGTLTTTSSLVPQADIAGSTEDSITFTTTFDGKIKFPNEADIETTIDLSPLHKPLVEALPFAAIGKLPDSALRDVHLSIRTFDGQLYFAAPDLWDGWIRQTSPHDTDTIPIGHSTPADPSTSTRGTRTTPTPTVTATPTTADAAFNSFHPGKFFSSFPQAVGKRVLAAPSRTTAIEGQQIPPETEYSQTPEPDVTLAEDMMAEQDAPTPRSLVSPSPRSSSSSSLSKGTSLLSTLFLPDRAAIMPVVVGEDGESSAPTDITEQQYTIVLEDTSNLHPLFAEVLGFNSATMNDGTLIVDLATKNLKTLQLSYQIPNTVGYHIAMTRNQRWNDERKGSIRKVQLALEEYYTEQSAYPKTSSYAGLEQALVPAYLKELPRSPGGGAFSFASSADGTYYELGTLLDPTYEVAQGTFYRVMSPRLTGNAPALLTLGDDVVPGEELSLEDFLPTTVELTLVFEAFPEDVVIERPLETALLIPSVMEARDLKALPLRALIEELEEYREAQVHDSERIADLEQLADALVQYADEVGSYPVEKDLSPVNAQEGADLDLSGNQVASGPLQALMPDYLDVMPVDPSKQRWYGYKSVTGEEFLLTCVLDNQYNPYAEPQTSFHLYRVTDKIPSIDIPTVSKSPDLYLDDFFAHFPVVNDFFSMMVRSQEEAALKPVVATPGTTDSPFDTTVTPTVTSVVEEGTFVSQDVAKASIEQFERDTPPSDLAFVEEIVLPYNITVYQFSGTLAGGQQARYLVHATNGEVVRRELVEPAVGNAAVERVEAELTAEAFATQHFDDFTKQQFLYSVEEGDDVFTFLWYKQDVATKAILPTQVQVEVNRVSGLVDVYAALRVPLALDDTEPRFTAVQAEAAAREAVEEHVGSTAQEVAVQETSLQVVADPANSEKQLLVWKVFVDVVLPDDDPNAGDAGMYTVVLRADSGSVVEFVQPE